MSDRQIRAAQRTLAQDPDNPQLGANLLRAMIQGGQVEPELIRQIASLGDSAGLILFPGEEQFVVREFLRSLGDKRFCVEFAVYYARKVLPIWEARYPDDDRPRLAIEAAQNWLSDPTEENADYAVAAASHAYAAAAAAYATDAAAAAAADAAAYAAYAASAAHAHATYAAYAAANTAKALGNVTNKQLLIEFLTKDVRIR